MTLEARGRRVWLILLVLGVLVFLVFAAGTTYSLLAPGYVFEDGELLGEAGILTGSAALVAFASHRLRVAERRILAADKDFGAWLPGEVATTGSDGVDLAGETRRLRRIARHAAALTLVWVALFAGGLTVATLVDTAAEDLLATGVRTAGVVTAVHNPAKGAPTMQVEYESPGRHWSAEIHRDSGRAYGVGDAVTAVYDPADPAHVRTTEEMNENQVLVGSGVVPMLVGLGGLPFTIVAAAGWRRRVRAVAATGWRLARVTVVPDTRGGRRSRLADVHVAYPDGSAIVLRCVLSTHSPGALENEANRRAWIGGWGRQMVVLFPYGPRKPGPLLVPVHATRQRVSRSPR
ncbi:DUF3592 domain-containing protein [Amycolatopsis sp. OK19-0408]|uniref:DUF3592 domain-containing protein n=1 Tax=Amycolatopsis iheyensis TaxID=2945988 RepID=A0A9X2NHX8_9PSEU|nr:DUF3592 domain-containing protein [Amycolatopsis iheyensis]MCR6488173.1 DUF3592 domain-containing protein [Amycolatopsis iheyensis]